MTLYSTDPTAVYTRVYHTAPQWKSIANVEGVCYFTFTYPNSAIVSDSCDHVGSQVCILVKFSFPHIFKQDFVPFVVHVFFSIVADVLY